MSRDRLLERFLRYVQVDTTAGEPGGDYPSSPGQLVLGKLLLKEMRAMGIADAEQDAFGLLYGTVPGVETAPVVALNSHLDTSPETTGKDVRPCVIEDYQGGDIPLSGNPAKVIRVADNPELEKLHGCTLITTDGNTLLGGDDKAGLAIILEAAQRLLEDPSLPRPTLRLLFTCDEEIGHGVDHVDLEKLGAHVCYTLDGPAADEINSETFSADLATVTVRGVNIHPSIAKGRMVNALRVASTLIEALPRYHRSPESTTGREGFLHPYLISGGVAEVTVQVLLRSFETEKLSYFANMLRDIAFDVKNTYVGSEIEVTITPQYRNLRDGLDKEPRAVPLAIQAHENLGRVPRLEVIRGGTDGSALTAKGLPTPNLSSGQHNPHSPLEFACLDEMEQAVQVTLELLRLWALEKRQA